MVSRAVLIVVALLVIAATATATTILFINSKASGTPQVSEEQRLTRERFFGSNRELPPIQKGQEMRPRW